MLQHGFLSSLRNQWFNTPHYGLFNNLEEIFEIYESSEEVDRVKINVYFIL